MELETPEWLTKEFMQKALENGKTYEVIIEDMEVDSPVPAGNNYMTNIFDVKINFRVSHDLSELHKKSFILKSPIKGPMYEMMVSTGIMGKEPMVYNELVPKLKSIFGEKFDDDNEQDESLLPKSYISSEPYVVILEDLRIKGYKMVERENQLDYEHCTVALISLAKFHAASVILNEKEPEFIKKVGKDLIYSREFDNTYKEFLNSNFRMIADNLRNNSATEKHSKWFEENREKFWDMMSDEVHCKENEFNVLNHGDFWLTNMMFRYDKDNKPIKNILIDLQCCRYSSPVIDLIYFFYTSLKENIRKDMVNDLIGFYVKELNFNLETLGSSKRLTTSELMSSLKERKCFPIFVSVNILPIVIADRNETKYMNMKDNNMEDFFRTESSPFQSYLKNTNYLDILVKRMDEFEHLGTISLTRDSVPYSSQEK